jgi:hypothetical protein
MTKSDYVTEYRCEAYYCVQFSMRKPLICPKSAEFRVKRFAL